MRQGIQGTAAACAIALLAACTSDKGATPADTATGQSTTVAPANASAPVLSAPIGSVSTTAPISPTASSPKGSTRPRAASTSKASTPKSATEEPMMRDSAFKPRATVDEKGNIQPIKRDSLR